MVVAAGCFNPHAPAGAPCSDNGECPQPFHCTAGVCTSDQPAVNPTVHVVRSGDGSGSITAPGTAIDCGSSCEATVDLHATITLIAAADVGSRFVAWSGIACAATDCSVVVDADMTAGAEFAVEPPMPGPMYALTVTPNGSGSGTITSNIGGINCGNMCSAKFAQGTAVTLAASASASSGFMGWSGSGCSGTGTCVVTMNQAQTVTAAFTAFFQVDRGFNGFDHDVIYPGYAPAGYASEGFAFRATATSYPGLRPIYNCNIAKRDAMLSLDPACEGTSIVGLVGYVYSASPGMPFFRCLIGTTDHMVSDDPNCEGTHVEFTLGYDR